MVSCRWNGAEGGIGVGVGRGGVLGFGGCEGGAV